MRVFISILPFLIYTTFSYGQEIELYRSSQLSTEPYGGINEMQDLINLQMNYPQQEYKDNINGDVFVLIKIDPEGKLISKAVIGESNENFNKEALRLSGLVFWEKNKTGESLKLREKKIKFIFSKRKYDKIVRKRGYKTAYISSQNAYPLKQLETAPQILKHKNLNDFIEKNIKYPSLALQQGISGIVKTEFIIEANGKISNIKIVKATAGGCNEETTRLLKKTNWQPGIIEGKPVRTFYSYSLNFVHPGNTYR